MAKLSLRVPIKLAEAHKPEKRGPTGTLTPEGFWNEGSYNIRNSLKS